MVYSPDARRTGVVIIVKLGCARLMTFAIPDFRVRRFRIEGRVVRTERPEGDELPGAYKQIGASDKKGPKVGAWWNGVMEAP